VPDTWTPDQISSYQKSMDDLYSGNLANRRRMKFVATTMAKTYVETKQPELSGTFDEWLSRIICFCFSLSPQPFVKMVNRATADIQKEAATEEGIEPTLAWVKGLIDYVIETEFGNTNVEFAWEEKQTVNEDQQKDILTGYVGAGIMTVNESREILGMDPCAEPAADEALVLTAAGYVPLNAGTVEGQKEKISAGVAPDPTKPAPVAPGAKGTGAKAAAKILEEAI
jgi:hypothetical protein